MLIGGYVCAVVLAPIGFVIGLVLAIRWNRVGHGLAICLLSAVVLVSIIVIENQERVLSRPSLQRATKIADCLNEPGHSFRECERVLR